MASNPKQRGLIRISLLCTLMLSLVSSSTSAQSDADRASVLLTLDACPTLAGDRVRNILGAELGASLIAHQSDVTTPVIDVVVACDASNTTLTVRDPITGAALVRHVALDVVHPLARERLVALAIAELVAAIGIELEATQTVPEPVEVEPIATVPVVENDPEVIEPEPAADLPRYRLCALGALSALGHPRRSALGGSVRFDHQPHDTFGWATALWARRGDIRNELGKIIVTEVALSLEGTIARHFRAISLQGAVGGSVGVARLRGDSSDDAVATGAFRAPILAPHLALRAFLRPVRGFIVVLGTELSFIVVTAHALVDGMRVVNIEGAVFTAQIGVGVEL